MGPPQKANKTIDKSRFEPAAAREPLGEFPEPTDVAPLTAPAARPVCLDALLDEWSDAALQAENWCADTGFVDEDATATYMPPWVAMQIAGWERASVIVGRRAEPIARRDVVAAPVGKDAKQGVIEWAEIDVDPQTTLPLPRVVVMPLARQPAEQGGSADEPARTPWPPENSFALERSFLPHAIKTDAPVPPCGEPVDAPAPAPVEEAPYEEHGRDERDALVAFVLRLVATYAETQNSAPFLWEAIYPQDAEGRPCYNRGGKYVLKLWLAGKWRRMAIDDRLPVDGAGLPVMVTSLDPRELWPSLLAKGLYKLWALVSKGRDGRVEDFLALSLQALAGWMSSAATPSEELQSCLRGAPTCTLEDVVLAETARLPGSPAKRRRRGRRNLSREPSIETLAAAVSARNEAAARMRELLDAPRDHLLVAVRPLHNAGKTFHATLVLAVIDASEAGSAQHDERELLLEWRCPEAKPDDFRQQIAPIPNHLLVTIPELFDEWSLVRVATGRGLDDTALLTHSWVRSSGGDSGILEPPKALKPTLLYVTSTGSLQISMIADAAEDEDVVTPSACLMLREVPLPGGDAGINAEEPQEGAPLTDKAPPSRLRVELSTAKRRFASIETTMSVPPGGRLYRVELEAPLGVCVKFACASPLHLGATDDVYRAVGGYVDVLEGTHYAIPAEVERVVFRKLIKRAEGPTAVELDVWLAEPAMRPHLRVHAKNLETSEETWHPLLETKALQVGPAGVLVTAVMRASAWRALPAVSWMLFVRSKAGGVSCTECGGDSTACTTTRFAGAYCTNPYLRLVRDIMRFPATALPLHLAFSASYRKEPVPIHLRICEFNDRSAELAIEDIDELTRLASQTTGSAGIEVMVKKDLGSMCVPALWYEGPLVLEVCVDSDTYDVAENFSSDLRWTLDIVAAAQGGIELRPDDADEATCAALRSRWEAMEPGRAERAAIVRAHALAQKAADHHPCEEDEESSQNTHTSKSADGKKGTKKGDKTRPADARVQALVAGSVVNAEVEAARERLRRVLPAPIVHTLPAKTAVVRTQAHADAQARARADALANLEDTADNIKARIATATERGLNEQSAHVTALRSWRHKVIQTTKSALAAREQHRLVMINSTTATTGS
ncbi:hypothetical protein CTAYLR_000766 [Chrysophaeum taylorii]|uniref:Calpain catalytic domain-containing protein n=1 Tax=Chrysophaeum taylorii TaxID=2483200 RepID=A0AAD7UP44_9STRA|nr:hypothetical protein CTAYLR_000766 [Chrysophaeum taylorii]